MHFRLSPALRTTTVSQDRGKVETVEPKVDDQRHQPYQDLLGAAASGTLTAEEQRLLKPHLDGCAECRADLLDFREIASALAMTLDERVPSPELRDRIEASIRQSSSAPSSPADTWLPQGQGAAPIQEPAFATPVQTPLPSARKPTPLRARYVWATAALVLLAVVAGTLAGRLIFADDSPENAGEAIALQIEPPIPNASGELTYLPDERVFKLTMHNMPVAPVDHVYQVWLIDTNGPIPVGMVDQASGQFAVAADRSRYDTFAITVEPGPLGSLAPTTDPIITALLTEAI